ncbi:MAG: hypothetical protein OSA23_16610 [Rhodospirillales bacterium]|nr:hypothetical protein [Rhodospirillales bacterium]
MTDEHKAALLTLSTMVGCKRLYVDTDYYDAFNRETFSIVSLKDTPIKRVSQEGLVVAGVSYNVDVIVFATGYDAMTGALNRINIQGQAGKTLSDAWKEGPKLFRYRCGRVSEFLYNNWSGKSVGSHQHVTLYCASRGVGVRHPEQCP